MSPSRPPRLFTYTLRYDDGAAPNPFRGMCSLAICKPDIRSAAKKNDWVAGLGSKNAPSGDLSGHLVYAMHVEDVLPFKDYDQQAPTKWPHRIPNINSADLSERLGDCIYDFSNSAPVQRPGVHGPVNEKNDLSGKNVLISRDFYYFGNRAIQLPKCLLPICHQTQHHKSDANAPYFDSFVTWIRGLNLAPGQIYGWPDWIWPSKYWATVSSCGGCIPRQQVDEYDELC